MNYIIYTKHFNWTLDHSWEKVYLKSIKMTLYNPLVISDEYDDKHFIGNFYEHDGKTFLTTTGLILKSSISKTPTKEELLKAGDVVANFFTKLRYASKQIYISKDGFVVAMNYQKQIKNTSNLKAKKIKSIPLQHYYIVTGIDAHKIKQADKLMLDKVEEKSFNDISLDAYESYITKDYRKSILYSAMASEIILRHQYVDSYSKILGKKSSKHRVIKVPVENKYKDPVIEHLLTSSKFNFDLLLHELPLYIFNSTIRYDKQKLYQDLKILHDTRNLIVHHGKVFSDKPTKILLPLDRHGGKKGLETLHSLYKYFKDDYVDSLFVDLGRY